MAEETMAAILGIPILLKAVDFLFDVAKGVLEERRQARREAKAAVQPLPSIPLLNQDRETVRQRKVSKRLAEQKEQAIQGILDELAIYQGNYQQLKKRVALEGGPAFAPVNVINQLRVQEDAILEASQRLATILDDLTRQG